MSITCFAYSQAKPSPPYRTSAGVKMGNKFQLSAKCFVNSDIAFDANFGYTFANSAPSFTLLFEYHHDLKYDGTYWYYGGGPAMLLTRFRNEIGVTAVVGAELVTSEKFINIFGEIQPILVTRVGSLNGGLTAPMSLDLNASIIISVGARYIFT